MGRLMIETSRSMLKMAKQLAEEGKKESDEVKLRAAVGRSYYACFLVARQKMGVSTKEDQGVHGIVLGALYDHSRRAGKGFGTFNLMKDLRDYRVQSDYFFPPDDARCANWIVRADDAVVKAGFVVSNLEKHSSGSR